MGIQAVGSAGQAPELSRGGTDAAAIDQRIRHLEGQLKRLKANKSLPEAELAKRIENVQKQIERLKRQREELERQSGEEAPQPDRRDAPQKSGEHLLDVYA